MNILQNELDSINQKLELLLYRKQQLDSIMSEYSDVIERVKSLVATMEDANVEPSNLLMEIEGLIYNPEPEPTPEELPTESEEQETDTVKPDTVEPDTVETEAPQLNALGLPVQTATPEPEATAPEQRGNSLLFQPNTYWDNGSSVRMFIAKKRRYRKELEAIIDDCIEQKLIEQFEINECGDDWIVQLSPVTDMMTVNNIIDNFYPQHTDGEPEQETKTSNPELVKLMALVPTVAIATDTTSEPTPEPIKTQLNERAWRRNDTLLIGFDNRRLMIAWGKWFNDSFSGRLNINYDENLDGFKYCLSVLWYGKNTDWERLSKLDYSSKPTEQKRIETDNFDYKNATGKTWQIFREGVLLGLAKDCDSHWESPQFKGEQFDSKETVADKLWELLNQF